MTQVHVREVVDDDLPHVAATFRAIVADGETYAYPEDADDATVRALWFSEPPGRTVVALDDHGRFLGTAKMGPNRPGRGAHVGTASFMVSPDARGLGVGRLLGQEMVEWHRAQGYAAIQFNAVVETNEVAVRLWQSLGFTIVGTVPGAFDSRRHGRVGLHVMHLPL